jgi:hypothetical protein
LTWQSAQISNFNLPDETPSFSETDSSDHLIRLLGRLWKDRPDAAFDKLRSRD